MKPHLIIKTKTAVTASRIPFWGDFIKNKTGEISNFFPEFDSILSNNHLNFWLTQEYKPVSEHWSNEEINSGLNRIYRVILKENFAFPERLLEQIKIIPLVEDVRPALVADAPIPIASSMSLQPNISRSREIIGLKQAHFYCKGNPSIKIAVLDTGVDAQHAELRTAVSNQADFVNLDGLDTVEFVGDITGYDEVAEDEVGHGSHVAGIIAGKGKEMPLGVVPECKIMAVRVLASMKQGDKLVGAGLIDNINVGIKWAIDHGADIINMSLGIKHSGGGLPHEEIIQYAKSKGVTIVAASGNDGQNNKYYPGALPGVIAVGAINDDREVADFSSYGANVSLSAPGTNIYSSYAYGKYAFASGTSQASPFVAGAVALLKSHALSKGYRLKDNQVKYILKHTSDKVNTRFKDEKAGYGVINLADAIKLLNYQLTS
ncbi:MAG: S8 family serine peptidase [Chitinophagales bacterium]|nr:S8 family serine peptidase [Chitinophagales bacterium]